MSFFFAQFLVTVGNFMTKTFLYWRVVASPQRTIWPNYRAGVIERRGGSGVVVAHGNYGDAANFECLTMSECSGPVVGNIHCCTGFDLLSIQTLTGAVNF